MKRILGIAVATILLITVSALYLPAAVMQIAGLAVAQSGTLWRNWADLATGDTKTGGVGLVSPCLWNGSSCDRQRGTITEGALTNISGRAADNSTNSIAKLPVLPCIAATAAAPSVWTAGNQVPCSVNSANGATWQQQLGFTASSQAGQNVTNQQSLVLFNSQTTGAANTAVVVTIAAGATNRAFLRSIEAQCSAGTSSITVQDGATTIFTSMGLNVPAAPATYRRDWNTPLTGSTNTAMTITLAACGVGNAGTLHVQADRV